LPSQSRPRDREAALALVRWGMASKSLILTLTVCFALISACGPDGPAAEGTESETGSGDGDGDPGDGDGDPGDGDGDPGSCVEPGTATASFFLDATTFDSMVDWDLSCTSGGVISDAESGYQILLDACVEANGQVVPAEMILAVDSSPYTMPNVPADIAVRLRWVQIPPFIPGKWFTLHADPDGSLLLAGLDGPSLLPSDAPDFSYAPLGVELVSIGCTPYEHVSQCGLAERMAFELMYDGNTTTISDQNSGSVGQLVSYEAIVGSALHFEQPTCDDAPDQILRALFFQSPEG
jgi:hypothetical protein